MLGDNEYGKSCVERLNGHIKLIRGNHDSDKRWNEVYPTIPNIELIGWADVINYQKYHFYLSHFPTLTDNYDDDNKGLRAKIISISGHTHKKEKFYNGDPLKYNVALDAHQNYPVLLDNIINDIKLSYVRLDKIL